MPLSIPQLFFTVLSWKLLAFECLDYPINDYSLTFAPAFMFVAAGLVDAIPLASQLAILASVSLLIRQFVLVALFGLKGARLLYAVHQFFHLLQRHGINGCKNMSRLLLNLSV